MKTVTIIIALILLSSFAFSQGYMVTGNQAFEAQKGLLFKTLTNYNAANADTTGWINCQGVLGVDVLTAREVGVLVVATDSAKSDFVFYGRNSYVTSITDSYADSINGENNTLNIARIMLKDATVNRLEGCTEFKMSSIFRSTPTNGHTTGRTCKFYLYYVR